MSFLRFFTFLAFLFHYFNRVIHTLIPLNLITVRFDQLTFGGFDFEFFLYFGIFKPFIWFEGKGNYQFRAILISPTLNSL